MDPTARARRSAIAVRRIEAATASISKRLQLAVELPKHSPRDSEDRRLYMLEDLATQQEAIVKALRAVVPGHVVAALQEAAVADRAEIRKLQGALATNVSAEEVQQLRDRIAELEAELAARPEPVEPEPVTEQAEVETQVAAGEPDATEDAGTPRPAAAGKGKKSDDAKPEAGA